MGVCLVILASGVVVCFMSRILDDGEGFVKSSGHIHLGAFYDWAFDATGRDEAEWVITRRAAR